MRYRNLNRLAWAATAAFWVVMIANWVFFPGYNAAASIARDLLLSIAIAAAFYVAGAKYATRTSTKEMSN